jgi:leucyl/phenylalanyl-tRNA--protein transferase
MSPDQPTLMFLGLHDALPDPATEVALSSGVPGLVAAGGGLSVSRLIEAYSKGCFPWFSENQPVLWWSPDPRMVLRGRQVPLPPLFEAVDKATAQAGKFEWIPLLMPSYEHCANVPRPGQSGTWIVQDMVDAYKALHRAGFAHSVETWIEGQLCGGLYCVSIGHAVFGVTHVQLGA